MPMTTRESKPHDASVLKICVNGMDQGDFIGVLVSRYIPQEIEFMGVAAMLTKMEQVMDLLGYPQKYRKTRTFTTPTKADDARERASIIQYIEEETFAKKIGKRATFVVQIVFRQNATWQGNIVWHEQEKSQQFNSTLELVKLMDDAITRSIQVGDETSLAVSW